MKTKVGQVQRVVWLSVVSLGLLLSPLSAQCPKLRETLEGRNGAVYCVAWSPDGQMLASGGQDATVVLWDVATAREKASLKGHADLITSLSWSPDGKTLASASPDSTVRLWDVQTGKQQATLRGHRAWVTSVAFGPDGKTLASGSQDQTIKLWDVLTGQEKATLRGQTGVVDAVAYAPDGKTLASGYGEYPKVPSPVVLPERDDNTIRLWDVATARERATLEGHTGFVRAVAYSPDGKTLLDSGEKLSL